MTHHITVEDVNVLNRHLAKIRKHAWELLNHPENSDDNDYNWLFAEMAWTWALTHLRAAVEISHHPVSSLPRMICFLIQWETYCKGKTNPDLFTCEINLKPKNKNSNFYQNCIDSYKSNNSIPNSKLGDLTSKIEEVWNKYCSKGNKENRMSYFDQINKFNGYNSHWNTQALKDIYSSLTKNMSWPLYPYKDAVTDLRDLLHFYEVFRTSLDTPCEIYSMQYLEEILE